LVAPEDSLKPESQYTIFEPSEIELGDTIAAVLGAVERVQPQRMVFDSLSELRLLAQSPLRYRRQILALKQFFAGRGCTVLLLDDGTSEAHDLQVHSIAHGVVALDQVAPEYGRARRRLRVTKMRGRSYVGGYHDFEIEYGGLRVFPRLVAADHRQLTEHGRLPSGIAALDELIPGGVDRGNSTLVMGPAGAGKSAIVLQYVMSAAARGECSSLFLFDESIETTLRRAAGMGFDLREAIASGTVRIRQIDPAEVSPGEFAALVREAVDPAQGQPASVVVIDSVNGYLQAMPEERFLVIQLHELLTYLGQLGVATFLVLAQHGLIGSAMQAPIDPTYLADIVVLLRYFEIAGEVRRAISVMKRRAGPHEKTIREFQITSTGIHVGPPATNLQGVLTGTPVLVEWARSGDDADRNS
jgi:circadian clock protein KaiC